jgi:hypothetical protein
MFRGGIFAILGVLVLGFALAAINTDIGRWGGWHDADWSPQEFLSAQQGSDGNDQDMNYKVTLWQVCGRVFRDNRIETCYAVTDHSITCEEFRHFFRSIQAFYILTAVFSLLSIVFAVLDHGNVLKFKHYRTILLFLAFMVFACSIVGWSLAIASVHRRFCGAKNGAAGWEAVHDQPDFEWGASPFLLVVATVFGMAMLYVAHRWPAKSTNAFVPLESA